MTEAQRTKLQELVDDTNTIDDQLHEMSIELIENRIKTIRAPVRDTKAYSILVEEIDNILSARNSILTASTKIENALEAELMHK